MTLPFAKNTRILVIDDSRAIHEDFRKILCDQDPLEAAETRLFGTPEAVSFQIDFTSQGAEGLSSVQQALAEGRPYAMAFVDVRMPPGWDGVETTRRIWEVYPDLQIVICTGYSDYSWNDLTGVLGQSDRLLILKKPFDAIEVVQLAHALTDKWRLLQASKRTMAELERAVSQRTAELDSSNAALRVEINERTAIAEKLRRTQAELEEQVEERTKSLQEAHASLEKRVDERTTELDVAKRKLQSVLDAATQVSIILTDSRGLIKVFNCGAERMLGYSADEMVNRRTTEILHDPAQWLERSRQLTKERAWPVEGFEVFVDYAREHPFDRREWTYVRKDGSRLDVSLIVTAVRDADGVIGGYLGIGTDITERKRLETALHVNNEQLAEQTRRAEAANRAKSDFLATMSHEIRTPMNGVVGMAELLLHTELSHEQREYAELVSQSADTLLTVINDILDFSKVESGRIDLERIDFVLRTALEEATNLLAERAQSKGLEMACLIHRNIPASVRGDPGRLRQIVTNLLGNAIKFTQAGEVVVRAKLAQESRDDVMIRIEISDTGVGISPDGLGRLFQSFSQADSSTTRRFGGTGLGLAISKRLTELMGGEIGVESVPGNGSTFWFTVRLGKTTAAQVVVPVLRDDLRGLYALAVDDNQTNLGVVRAQTRAWGMVCDSATDGSRALQMIGAASHQRPYDVVILDMRMPGMDGFELAQAIKGNPANEMLKLVLMTSTPQRGQAARSGQVGIAAFLTKPVRKSQLYECLRTVMGPSAHASPQAVQETPKIVTAHSLKEATDLRRPHVLLAEDNQTNQMAAVRILEMLGYQVDVAINGLEAVAACRDGDYGLVLMDNQMPEMDGLTAAREIRTFERLHGRPPVPIVALTANAMQGDREKCMAAGMNDYLSKPFKVVQLKELIERWGLPQPPAAPAPGAVPRVDDEFAIDSSVFDQFLGAGSGAQDFVTKLIDQYVAESASRMEALRDAVERCDAPALRLVTHGLKGASGTVGANRMAAMCAELEMLARSTTFHGIPALVTELEDEFARVRHALQVVQASTG